MIILYGLIWLIIGLIGVFLGVYTEHLNGEKGEVTTGTLLLSILGPITLFGATMAFLVTFATLTFSRNLFRKVLFTFGKKK